MSEVEVFLVALGAEGVARSGKMEMPKPRGKIKASGVEPNMEFRMMFGVK